MKSRRMPFLAMLRWVILALVSGTLLLLLDTWIFGSIPWSVIPERPLSGLRGWIGFAGVAAALTLLFALAVSRWSPRVSSRAVTVWLLCGALNGLTPVALWLAVTPVYYGAGGFTMISFAMGVLPPIAATIAFVILVVSGLVARRSGPERL